MTMNQHWLIIASGGTQHFIFDSNKRKLNVGASALVAKLPEWVEQAKGSVQKSDEVEVVVCISGIAQVLVPDRETGKEIIKGVTSRALNEAPGLQVWGWVSPEPVEDLAAGLKQAMREHEQVRAELPPPSSRFPGFPFTSTCRFTGLPASTTVQVGARADRETVAVSEVASAKWKESWEGLDAIRDLVGEEAAQSVLSKEKLEQDIGETWTALVHADGNGIGQMFISLGDHFQSDYLKTLKALSTALDQIAGHALREAILETANGNKEWILPLVVGGDDLTALVDARLARTFTLAYLRAFEEATAKDTTISNVAKKVLGRDGGLTASAGLAIVKPTHPFHHAYSLCKELCDSAKAAKRNGMSAMDLQVFHECVGRTLEDTRHDLRAKESSTGRSVVNPPLVLAEKAPVGAFGTHAQLEKAISAVSGERVSSSERHRIRSALTLLPTTPEIWDSVLLDLAAKDKQGVDHSILKDMESYLLTAIDLIDVENL